MKKASGFTRRPGTLVKRATAKRLALLFLLRGFRRFFGLRLGLGFRFGFGFFRRFGSLLYGCRFLRGSLRCRLRRSGLDGLAALGAGASAGSSSPSSSPMINSSSSISTTSSPPSSSSSSSPDSSLSSSKLSFSRSIPSSPGGFPPEASHPADAGWHVSSRCRCNGPESFCCDALQSLAPLLPYSPRGCQESWRGKPRGMRDAVRRVSRLQNGLQVRTISRSGLQPSCVTQAGASAPGERMGISRSVKSSFCRKRQSRPERRGWSFSWGPHASAMRPFRADRLAYRYAKPCRGRRGWS